MALYCSIARSYLLPHFLLHLFFFPQFLPSLHYYGFQYVPIIVLPDIVHSQYCSLCFLTVWLESNHGIWGDVEGPKSLPLFDMRIHNSSSIFHALSSLLYIFFSILYSIFSFPISLCRILFFRLSCRLPCICLCLHLDLWSSLWLISLFTSSYLLIFLIVLCTSHLSL